MITILSMKIKNKSTFPLNNAKIKCIGQAQTILLRYRVESSIKPKLHTDNHLRQVHAAFNR